MLLRAGIIYALAVICLLFAALAAWQRLEIFANSENVTMLAERAERLQGELDAAVLASRSAERRAMVAEDSLARQSAFNVSDGRYLNEARENLAATLSAKAAADLARTRLEADLAAAVSERDAARREALALSAEVGEAQRAVKAAEDAAELAEQKLEAANTQMSRVPPTASSGSPGTIDPGGSLQRDGKAAVETGSLPPQEGQSTSTGTSTSATSTSATSTSESTAKAETPPVDITPDAQAAPSSAPQHAGPEQTGPQPGSGPSPEPRSSVVVGAGEPDVTLVTPPVAEKPSAEAKSPEAAKVLPAAKLSTVPQKPVVKVQSKPKNGPAKDVKKSRRPSPAVSSAAKKRQSQPAKQASDAFPF